LTQSGYLLPPNRPVSPRLTCLLPEYPLRHHVLPVLDRMQSMSRQPVAQFFLVNLFPLLLSLRDPPTVFGGSPLLEFSVWRV
jgi:hypothetical protein